MDSELLSSAFVEDLCKDFLALREILSSVNHDLMHISGLVMLANPQISAPTMGIPNWLNCGGVFGVEGERVRFRLTVGG